MARAQWQNAVLDHADLSHADLRGCDMAGASLLRAQLHGALTEGARIDDHARALTQDPQRAEAERWRAVAAA